MKRVRQYREAYANHSISTIPRSLVLASLQCVQQTTGTHHAPNAVIICTTIAMMLLGGE